MIQDDGNALKALSISVLYQFVISLV